MHVCLVPMPWHAIDTPSLAIGVLHSLIEADHDVSDVYGTLRWAEFILDRSDGIVTPAVYTDVSDVGIFDGLGDWVFAAALEESTPGDAEYLAAARSTLPGTLVDHAVFMRGHAVEFVEMLAGQIDALRPDVVGFTSTFMQNVPALSVAKALRKRGCSAHIVFGGANCDGPMGAALHRNYPFIDHVVRGEGELAFPRLLAELSGSRDFAAIPGLCWRDGESSVANPKGGDPVEMEAVPPPNYDAFFRELEQSPVEEFIEPKLVVEAARGCWWGAKQHCTFCGLNGTTMAFRSKPATVAWEEISTLIARHRVLDVIAVDNIMDMKYFRDFLPLVAGSDWDLRVHYEVKSNLTAAQIEQLRDARVAHIQPGIESLSARVLKLMRKGVTGCQNVMLLRECEQANLTVSWNYLYGFPDERPDDYAGIVDQMRHLVHLQPPAGAARIGLQRFSPNFDDPSLGFDKRAPAYFYRHLYAVPEPELEDIAYLFESESLGLSGAPLARLSAEVGTWKEGYRDAFLEYSTGEACLVFRDGRGEGAAREIVYDSRLAVDAYESLAAPRSRASLGRDLTARGIAADAAELDALLDRFVADGVVFQDSGSMVAIALKPTPRRIKNLN